ncbi:NAD(P)/FAD-dependent oxidoreductase [Streptomyces sp. NPDC004237]|uniref:flavin-containing monooxygenase n=1 Tax=Streptomyces sp. NPDC004237 TaxID=3154455 RepID=UPI0033A9B935
MAERLDVDIDVVVVGAGLGGIYAVHRLRQAGLSVVGIEGASDVGGVWFHNRYPGARVDLASLDYSYHFSDKIWREWRWSERYAAQPELLAYLNFAASELDVRRDFLFDTWVTGARWNAARARYELTTSTGASITAKYLVMTTGQLSAARPPAFPGLDQFRGRVVMTSHWPHDHVETHGKRIGLIGTGSSGVQAAPPLAEAGEHLYVFQRTPNYAVPAQNAPAEEGAQEAIGTRLADERERLISATRRAVNDPIPQHPVGHYSKQEQQAILRAQWERGGTSMNRLFTDQGTDLVANTVVADFVRDRVRETVRDPRTAESLLPTYPIGVRRLILENGYYEMYNRENVTLVDIRSDPITEITPGGIRTRDAYYEIDLLVFALGFDAFTGSLRGANIRDAQGVELTSRWTRGPRNLLGMMTTGFPNLFMPTGAGSPSVLANLFLQNEFAIDWITDCIAFMESRGYASIEPTEEAEDEWAAHVAEAANTGLRMQYDNYMVHVNKDDGSRVFMPYLGGMESYVKRARAVAADGFTGFKLS